VTRAGAPLVVAERFVPLEPDVALRLAFTEDATGQRWIALFVEAAGARPAAPALTLPATAGRELSRALALLVAEAGLPP